MEKLEVIMEMKEGNLIRLYANKVYNTNGETYHGDIFTTKNELLKHYPNCEVMKGYGLLDPETSLLISATNEWFDTIEEAVTTLQALHHNNELDSLYEATARYYNLLKSNAKLASIIEELDNRDTRSFPDKVISLYMITGFATDWISDEIAKDKWQEVKSVLEKANAKCSQIIMAHERAKKALMTIMTSEYLVLRRQPYLPH